MKSLTGRYLKLYQSLETKLPVKQLITDSFQTQVYGTDASFYRLQPKLIVLVNDLSEVALVMTACQAHQVPFCFRAAGTSLSGQAITDSVLVKLSEKWQDCEIQADGAIIDMQCGVLGSTANRLLAPLGYKLGPMPASIDAATAGGMAINNAAGMNSLDSYGQMRSAKFAFLNGSHLDTSCAQSRVQFSQDNPELMAGITALRDKILSQPALTNKIRQKYKIKNTTGYSLRAFVDYHDPIDIIAHLMIGSEGTLGFIESISHFTVPLFQKQSVALVVFNDLESAGVAIQRFKQAQFKVASNEDLDSSRSTSNSEDNLNSNSITTIEFRHEYKEPLLGAAELIDANALRAVLDLPGMSEVIGEVAEKQVALLIQVEAASESSLRLKQNIVRELLSTTSTAKPIEFFEDETRIQQCWQMRKAIFPAVGANRPANTTALIEDVAFPIEQLPEALNDLHSVLNKHGYRDAVIYGHALDGNLHFIFSQNFTTQEELQRYQAMMEAVVDVVVKKYQGSLKAEHGTGRNMAPFVQQEWGEDLYQVMVELKALFDPDNLLNPNVMLTQDPELYVKNIKPIFSSNELIDKCIECGFCERNCPSQNVTFTPRQRIVGYREIQHQLACQTDTKQAEASFSYLAEQTCAGCGLCETSCPVSINVGDLIREQRQAKNLPWQGKIASFAQRRFSLLMRGVRVGLRLKAGLPKRLARVSKDFLKHDKVSGPDLPQALSLQVIRKALSDQPPNLNQKVVLFSSCISRVFAYPELNQLAPNESRHSMAEQGIQALVRVFNRAGVEVKLVSKSEQLCCGLPFKSKGFPDQAKQARHQLYQELLTSSENGRWPVLADTSQCAAELIDEPNLSIVDPLQFVATRLLPILQKEKMIKKKTEKVAFHLTCSARKSGHQDAANAILAACADMVIQPMSVNCCGFSGDKGFAVPELNASALQGLAAEVADCEQGYSTSRTCEIGLSHHSGLPYRSVFFLLDECTRPD